MRNPLVSVVIPTFNEKKNIASCLESIQKQSCQLIEVLVIDSLRTSDDTVRIASHYPVKIFRYGLERSEQRNFGAKKSKGEYILFVDSDMILEKCVIEECLNKIKSDRKLGAIIIPEKSFGENYWAKCKALERNCYIGDETIEAARFFKRKIFELVGGYNQKMISGEDWDLTRRVRNLGWRIGRIQSFILHNEGKLSLINDLKKKLYYSRMSDEYLNSSEMGIRNIFLFIFRPSYFRNWRILLSDPIHLPGFVFMKLSEFLVGGFGAIVYKKAFWRKVFPFNL